MDVQTEAVKLAAYTESLRDFEMQSEIDRYDHMGALIVDAVLQAGVNYDSVVKPRVLKILNDFPEARTTTGFLKTLSQNGAEQLLNFRGDKPTRVLELASFLLSEGVETTDELATWIRDEDNQKKLKRIKGIKHKTVDYMAILAGNETNAIDRHLLRFLQDAEIHYAGYEHAHAIITMTAQILEVSVAKYDHSIWTYIRERESNVKTSCKDGN